MNIFADRVKETTTTTGTGDITLLGAVAQFQAFGTAFTSFPATVSYAIVGQSGAEWEVGVGTLTDATTLERTTVQDSSNAGAAVSFSAGTKDVFATLTAQDLADITTALAGKAATVHTHAISDTTGLQTALDGKAASSHTHTIADTTGLQTALDGKAASSHTHAIADTTGLQTALDGKASTSHSHAATDLTSGTLPDAVFPATLPAASGVNLTALNASNLASGTVADARLSSNVALENVANNFSTAQTVSVNGAASTSPLTLSGSWFTGGTTATTYPGFLMSPAGATMPSMLTNGTGFLINAASGFTGYMLAMHVNGSTPKFTVDASGNVTAFTGNISASVGSLYLNTAGAGVYWSNDTYLIRDSAAILQQGIDSATPITQTFKGPDARAGTDTNTAGGILNIAAGRGTGTAAGGELRLQTSEPTSSGTAAGTLTTRLAISGTAITASLPIVLQGYTVATLPAASLVAGMSAFVTDATAPLYNTALTGGGAVTIPVFYNGAAWVSA